MVSPGSSPVTPLSSDVAPRVGRIGAIDVTRGLAILGMVAFHLDWDLAYLGFVRTSPAGSPAWMILGHTVAALFLCLSGVGLTLARPLGRARALRRIGVIAAAALAVTSATLWLFPQDAITFGILHCIVVTNLVALALLDTPTWLLAGVGAASAAAPWILTTGYTEGPWWWWLGLSRTLPRTLDYRPVLPWLGPVLLGAALARFVPHRRFAAPRSRVSRALAFAGRHSLPIYLVHQPVLLGLLVGVAAIAPPSRSDIAGACKDQCVATGAGLAGCEAACTCAASRLSGSSAAGPAPQIPNQSEIEAVSRACVSAPAATPQH